MKTAHPKFQSPESLVLRFMREKRKLSVLNVAKAIDLKPKDLDYMENGKKIISDEIIERLLLHYKFSSEVFKEMLQLSPLAKKEVNMYFINKGIY